MRWEYSIQAARDADSSSRAFFHPTDNLYDWEQVYKGIGSEVTDGATTVVLGER